MRAFSERSDLAPAFGGIKVSLTTVSVRARERLGFVDVTDDLRRAVADSHVSEGFVVAFCEHTTCALVINEWESGALDDLRSRIGTLVPGDVYYAHDDFERRTENLQPDERINGQAHVIQMIVGGTSHSIPVVAGEPLLGRWQRLFLFELDEPKNRSIHFRAIGL